MEYDYATDIEVQREEAFEKGVSKGIQQGLQQGLQQGVSQGEHQKAIETAKKMLKDKLDIETIIKYTGLSIEAINNLVNTNI